MKFFVHLRPIAVVLAVALFPPLAGAAEHSEERDCGDVFGFLGTVQGLKYSPVLPGDLGTLVIEGMLLEPYAARRLETVHASWEIAIETAWGVPLRRWSGVAALPDGNPTWVRVKWDGTDESGESLPDGEYFCRFYARGAFVRDLTPDGRRRFGLDGGPASFVSRDEFAALATSWHDSGYTDALSIFLDRTLSSEAVLLHRNDPSKDDVAVRSLPTPSRVNAPHEPIPYKFYYGNPHAHTTRSDGGGDAPGDCATNTGRVDGSYSADYGIWQGAYTIASTVGDLDTLVIAEHNHLIDNAFPSDTRPVAPADGPGVYAQGRADALAATNPAFVGFYGMEWGTTTGCGHIVVYDSPKLFGWEAGWYDTLTPNCTYSSQAGPPYVAGLYETAAMAANVSPATSLPHLSFCHPSDANMFNSYARDAFAEAAVRSVAVVSGSATGCSESFPEGGTSLGPTYKDRYIQLLEAGWKLGTEGHQDNHGNNYGNHSEVRTVYLAESLTPECILKAQYNRRLYATQDRDGQLIFTATATSNGIAHHMGEEMGGSGGVAFHSSWWQPDNGIITSYRILRGQVGGGCRAFSCLTVVATGFSGSPFAAVTIDVNENLPSGKYFYIVEILQPSAFTRNTVSAPIIVDYGIADAGVTPARCGCTPPTGVATATKISPAGPPCGSVVYQLDVTPSGGSGSGYTYRWSPSTGLSNPNIKNPTATISSTTIYSVTITDSVSCASSPVPVTAVASNPAAAASATPNRICTGGSSQLYATPTGGVGPYTFSWSPTTGLDNPTSQSPRATPSSTTIYGVTVTDSLGCVSPVGNVTLTVNPGTPPPTPTGVTATATASDVTVVWDNVLASGTYYVYRSSAGCAAGSFVLVQTQARTAGAQNSWVDTTVVSGTTYCYRVSGDDGNCEGSSSSCGASSCATPTSIPEISGGSATEKLKIREVGAGLEFRFQWLGAGYRYDLYSVADQAALDAGNYSGKWCDLATNTAGSWATDPSGWATFTVTDGSTVPASNYLVIAEIGWEEGPYGYKSTGARRPPDADLRTALQTGCPAEVVPTVGSLLINELHIDPHTSEGNANGDGIIDARQDEFVEIINTSANTLILDGLTVDDTLVSVSDTTLPGIRHTFPAGTYLLPCKSVVVFGGPAPTGGFGGAVVQLASTGEVNLSNSGDTILVKSGGTTIDSTTYTSSWGSDQSLVRNPEGRSGFPFVTHTSISTRRFSPGTKVSGAWGCWSATEPGTPSCTISSPTAGIFSGSVTVTVTLTDPDSSSLDLLFEYSTNGGTSFANATAAAGSPLSNPALGTPTGSRTFRWDTAVDLGVVNTPVVLRVTVNDGASAPSICTSSFTVDNTGGPVSPVSGSLVINEIHYDPHATLGDANLDGAVSDSQDEFVEIVSLANQTVALEGVTISDDFGVRHVFPPGSNLFACRAAVVFGGGAPNGAFGGALVQVASDGSLGLSNSGDSVKLALGATLLDSHSYPNLGSGVDQALVRNPENQRGAPFAMHTSFPPGLRFSPGTKIDGTTNCWNGPTCLILSPTGGNHKGDVGIVFDLSDPNTPSVTVTFQYSTNGGTSWLNATASGSSVIANPASLVPGTGYQFIWNSAANVPGVTQVLFRIQVNDGSTTSTCNESFLVNNTGSLVVTPTAGDLVINEVNADPAAGAPGDANGDGISDTAQDEFVEIVNVSSEILRLDGLTISDSSSTRHVFPVDSFLRACQAVVVFGGGTPTGAFGGALVQTASSGGLVLNNSSPYDAVTLTYSGVVLDTMTYGVEAIADQSVVRSPEATFGAPFVQHTTLAPGVFFTPGVRVDGSTACWIPAGAAIPVAGNLVVNEIHADPHPTFGDANGDGFVNALEDEFVELVNVTTSVLILDGMTVSDAVGVRHTFPTGTFLAPCRSVVLFAGGTPSGSFGCSLVQTANTGLLGLNDANDSVTVRRVATVINAASWSGISTSANQSLVRNPEAGAASPLVLHTTLAPTRRYSPGTKVDGSSICWSGAPATSPTVTVVSPTSGCQVGDVTVVFDVTDPDSCPVNATFEYSTNGGSSYSPASADATSALSNPDDVTPGTGLRFVWSSATDLPGSATVTFRVTANDAVTAPGSGTSSFTVNNAAGSCVGHLVISQVYGGGGNAGAPFNQDFVELYNCSNCPVSLAGWSIQYASAAGNSWSSKLNLAGSVASKGYFLIGLGSGGAVGAALPAVDCANLVNGCAGTAINMSGTTGKIALVNSTTQLPGVTCPITEPTIVDFVGYGTTANCFEGAGPTANLSNTTAAIRNGSGCTDSDQNNSNFTVATPTPRNSASTPFSCP